jgi:probable HAF family extracellular repeat protein
MKRIFVVLLLALLVFSLAGCGGSGSSPLATADPAADPGTDPGTDPDTDPGTDPDTDPGTDPDTTIGGSLGTLTDIGDYLNAANEEWFFATTIDINLSGQIIGESPLNNPIFWDPASPDSFTFIPSHWQGMANGFGGFYDDFYNQKSDGGSNEFVAWEVLEINDNGLVLGNAYAGEGESRGFVWDSTNGNFTDLTPPSSYDNDGKRVVGQYSKAVDINANGEILVDVEFDDGNIYAVYWDGVTTTSIDDLLDDNDIAVPAFNTPVYSGIPTILRSDASQGVAMNDNGQFVTLSGGFGIYYDSTIGGWASMNSLPGASESIVVDINNNKHAIGTSGSEGFFWRGGVMYPISNPSGDSVEVVDINDNDIVVGNSGGQAFVWQLDPATDNGIFTSIGTLGGSSSTAVAINNQDRVIGFSQTGNVYQEGNVTSAVVHGFLWQNDVMYDLGAHSPPNYTYPFDPDFYFSEATAINENGDVTGKSYSINAHARGFTLTPVFPAP